MYIYIFFQLLSILSGFHLIHYLILWSLPLFTDGLFKYKILQYLANLPITFIKHILNALCSSIKIDYCRSRYKCLKWPTTIFTVQNWTRYTTRIYPRTIIFYLYRISLWRTHNKHQKKKTLKKVNKTISFLRKLQRSLLRAPLGTIYKSFMKTYIDYSASSTSLK